MEPKKRRRKIHYRIMLISDSSEGKIHQMFLGKGTIAATAVLLVACICLMVYGGAGLTGTTGNTEELKARVSELATDNKNLVTKNTELSEKVTALSQTVIQKVQEEEAAAEKSVPTGFPLSGAAAIQEDDGTQEAGKDIVVFVANAGTAIIATGSGTVASVEADAEYGYILTLDHGNGYTSIYRDSSEPKVKAGDEVTKGTMLFEMGTDGEKLGYQIMKDGEYIAPLELMEIYG